MTTISIIGNPNSGKTTLFNKLTGLHKRVGNWSGVTVDKHQASLNIYGRKITAVDLPGCYSLVTAEEIAIDEQLTCLHLLKTQGTIIVNVIDASHISRDLYLTLQLLEQGLPVVVALNASDIAAQGNMQIHVNKLAKLLDCPVIPIVAKTGRGLHELRKTIYKILLKKIKLQTSDFCYLPLPIQNVLNKESHKLASCYLNTQHNLSGLMLRLLEGDNYLSKQLSTQGIKVTAIQDSLTAKLKKNLDICIAIYRHKKIRAWLHIAVSYKATLQPEFIGSKLTTNWLDKVFLHRLLGIPIFLLIIYMMFVFAIAIGMAFQSFFDLTSQAILMELPTLGLQAIAAPSWVYTVLVEGIGRGLNVTFTFIPVLMGIFLFFSFLEESGYIVRAVFVMDRLMRFLGLPGKSFVPMIIGFSCNVPAVLSSRTIEKRQERILTIIMTPFMSCNGRLAIYAVFVSAFFPMSGQNIIFYLYLIGILTAVLTGLLLRKAILYGNKSTLVMELPKYRWPRPSTIWRQTCYRLKRFLMKATAIIVPLCIAFSFVGTIKIDDASPTVLERLGKQITPIFKPMGIQEDNWPATVGLITGMMAKEVIIGTLDSLYMQKKIENVRYVKGTHQVVETVQEGIISVLKNFQNLKQALLNPVLSQIPKEHANKSLLGMMSEKFHNASAAFAYLIFVLLYFPCVSVVAAIARELSKRWALFSIAWSTGLAYVMAVSFYQIATFSLHPVSSIAWIAILMSGFAGFVCTIYKLLQKESNIIQKMIPTRVLVTDL